MSQNLMSDVDELIKLFLEVGDFLKSYKQVIYERN